MDILDKSLANVPERRAMPIIGNALTAEVRELDKNYFNQVGKFREDAEKLQQELESKEEGIMYTFLVTVGDKQEEKERWCQGVVKLVLKDSRQPREIMNMIMILTTYTDHWNR